MEEVLAAKNVLLTTRRVLQTLTSAPILEKSILRD